MALNCYTCKKAIEGDAFVCDAYDYNDDPTTCEHTHGNFLCKDCIVFDEKDNRWRCKECQANAYFICDCCHEQTPMTGYYHMGTCYAERGCGCEDICRDCASWSDKVDSYICADCAREEEAEDDDEPEPCFKCQEPLTFEDNCHKGFSDTIGGDRVCHACYAH